MINLQDGIDMQTVSKLLSLVQAARLNLPSIWESTRELYQRLSLQICLTFHRAVHNFCTSQKAVGSATHGVIGGAHRGGKLHAVVLESYS